MTPLPSTVSLAYGEAWVQHADAANGIPLMRHPLEALTYTVLLMLAAVAPASACRHYSIWGFPWAQRCSVSTPVRAVPVTPTPPVRDTDMPLPDLTPVVWGDDRDEDTRGRLLLRAALAR